MEHFMRTIITFACYTFLWLTSQAVSALGQEAILPHGDPRLQSSQDERARREDIRDQRLKQQGQGSNYRIEGELQPSSGQAGSAEPAGAAGRQDTGISDPSVNPGQAAGMKTVQGRIIETQGDQVVIHQPDGMEVTLVLDGETKGETDLHPGDVITGLTTPQGRAITIQKEQATSPGR
jgi:hypothetical protein